MENRAKLSRMVKRTSAMLAVALAQLLGCSSSDNAAPSTPDASTDPDAPIDLCDTFTHSGDPCDHASANVCFPECATGGCWCVATAAGPRWKCTTDVSCLPDGSPVDFDAGGSEDGDATDAPAPATDARIPEAGAAPG